KQAAVAVNNNLQVYEAPKIISTAIEGNPSAGEFKVRVKTNAVSSVTVKVPIWSDANGQDDLKWYVATKVKDGEYLVTFDGNNHKKQSGAYHVQAYAYNGDKQAAVAVNNNLQVYEAPKIISTAIEGNPSAGEFKVRVKTNAVSSVTVKVPIWSDANGQDDLKWYVATKVKDGEYLVTFDGNNHKKQSGAYHVHAYAYNGDKQAAVAVNNNLSVKF
ncbi:GBS Bsp-like repeat-containing protein, partial [Lactococcus hodotermopsidis]|uniref:GBS Bsp-like repeat-containing protein n=1 Tax=Pseudolactococcus hodotermopsidis TaxID=2709157 RepID=UPI001556C7C5